METTGFEKYLVKKVYVSVFARAEFFWIEHLQMSKFNLLHFFILSLMTTSLSWVEHLHPQHWIFQWLDSMGPWRIMPTQDTHSCQWWLLYNSTTHHPTTIITWLTIWKVDSQAHLRGDLKPRDPNKDRIRGTRVDIKDHFGLEQIEWQKSLKVIHSVSQKICNQCNLALCGADLFLL